VSKQIVGIALLVLSLLCVGVTAQESRQFREALARNEENFAGLLSYSAKVRVFEKTSEKLTVGDDVLDNFSLTEYEFLSDVTRDSILIVKNRYSIDASYHADDSQSAVYLRSKGKAFRITGSRLIAFDDANLPIEGFFDPRVIGVGFCFEIRSFNKIENVFSNIRAWKDSLSQNHSNEDFLIFGQGKNKFEFLKKSGYAISLIEHSGVSVRTTYVEKSGIFLPSLSAYQCAKGRQLVFECEWFAVNEPIPAERFQADRVASLLGLKLK
jgi:hypothetical protein